MSTSSVLYDAPGPKARRLSRIVSVLAAVVVGGAVAWLLWALGQPRVTVNGAVLTGLWSPERWDIFGDPRVWRRLMFDGLLMGTLRAAGLAAVLSLVLGVVLCFARTAPQRWISVPAAIVLEFFRGMPVLLMMLFILLALGTGGYTAVVLALTVYNGAIIGEALRAGLLALPKGQREAGLSVGLSSLQTRLSVEFPQAFRQMLPIIVAQLVVLLKDTSLAYVVSYPEILRVSGYLKDYYGSTRYSFSIFAVVLLTYLAVNFTLSAIARWLARRSGPHAGVVTPIEQP
ncbi:MAG TPA: amino acid ABC transporter permease [Arachnia sp.]|nr:amino acid ABC transporter permease [Arachnia sp.]HMR12226.1 amino acid ABC transporter permease [Arachnia sp.]